ncbi:MAG: DUF554 domain-containing protein [Dethiobacteria bacterium]|jgi:uncharacterized membrane protein YqgA involved in biofilm formation
MLGTLVNVAAILIGALLGHLLKAGLPERIKGIVLQAVGLSTFLIALKMVLEGRNVLIIFGSLLAGAVTGELLMLEERLQKWGMFLQRRFSSSDGGTFTQGFVTASLLYCVGAMAVMGSLESGLTGNHATLFAKAVLDGISAIMLTASLGLGVAFSALPVFLYQGGITVLAGSLRYFLTEAVMAEMTATGGLLILGISLNILEIKEIKVGNLLPALLYAFILALIFS